MNRTKLKNYAPQARRDFIQAMTDRAAYFGLTETKIEPVVEKGDVAVIGGRSHPRAVAKKRKTLEDRIKRNGFEPTMEAMAYTWFNRLVAIRFMERHGYLEHGYRVLSHPEGKPTPEILEHAEHVDLPGLKKEAVIDLKLAGNKESELYRLLLTAQCNALHSAMPFLFEKIDDETELLLPDNLLHSNSLIRNLVNEIDEEDWQEVEIIGWLYQFYISERKDEVIGKVVASEDIPAATQLFTPNWIVKYLVQNTLGRQWLATYPQSALRQQMEYYIEPAEQTPEVQEQLKTITPTSLNPEELTLLDPACGSGHILVEAYDLFKAIYQERGYRAKDIPALILQKNLFGLEIDDRAAQLAAFALMMKARADDRRIFDSEAKPNVVAIQDSKGLKAEELAYALNAPINKEDAPKEYLFEDIQEEKDGLFNKKALAEKGNVSQADIASLVELFENAKTFGSLIQIPQSLAAKLQEIVKRAEDVLKFGDLTHASAHVLKPLLNQTRLLARQYDAVVANPPYMGSKYMAPEVKVFAKNTYPTSKHDMYAMFIERCVQLSSDFRRIGLVTPYAWMFIRSYEQLREYACDLSAITSLIQLEYNAFEPACVPVCTYTLFKSAPIAFQGDYINLSAFRGHESQAPRTLEAIQDARCSWRYRSSIKSLRQIPGTPLAYWVSDSIRSLFETESPLSSVAEPKQGMSTANNAAFVRFWSEVDFTRILLDASNREEAAKSSKRWFPLNKGGDFRKWYGNVGDVVDWEDDGRRIKGSPGSAVRNRDCYFRPGVTWTDISSSFLGARMLDKGFLFANTGSCVFSDANEVLLGLLVSKVAGTFLKILNPTFHCEIGDLAKVPIRKELFGDVQEEIIRVVRDAVGIARIDWHDRETSWGFRTHPLLLQRSITVQVAQVAVEAEGTARLALMKQLEEENNRLFIKAYCLEDELDPEVPDEQITLYRPDRAEDIKRLLSYAIGCMMGRYSLDTTGLIYANTGNQGFDPSQYKTFRADDDGIIPLLETDWGIRDDATNRFVEFIGVAWPKEHLEENLKFVADSLGSNNGEQARETIRRYLATGFYKQHLSMYKKRPIYWLFSSGKQRAFQCLVYLHRYNEGTLARMRTEYVIPLLGKMNARLSQLEGDIPAASSATVRRKLEKERDAVKKQIAELQEFDARLRHYADQRIKLDLDDGVKVNYGKFSDPDYGDILADVKAICGTKDEE